MNIRTIEWKNDKIKIIDQTKLPGALEYLCIGDIKVLYKAIKKLKVRGAPALGAAAALGVYLGVRNSKAKTFMAFKKELNKAAEYIGSSRPTARNLFWALERILSVAGRYKGWRIDFIKKKILEEAQKIIKEDRSVCRKIGKFGASLFKNHDTVLTVCNAGVLATIDYGTALGMVYSSCEQGKNIKVYACETRPLLQGARLTSWELKNKGIDVTLICDNMAATLMAQGKVNKVIAGADRIAANADTANKIGTYNLAVLCSYHHIPFYIAAPSSTFDLNTPSGKEIIIEERDPLEVTDLFFKKPIARGVKVYNPAFDVTPHGLISAIVTEKGIIRPPYEKNIRKVVGS